MRDRVNGPFSTKAEVYTAYQYSTAGTCSADAKSLPALVKTSIGVADTSYYKDSMSDIVTPNFKELSAKGHIINNPMSKFKESIVNDILHYNLEYGVDMYLACVPAKWVYYRNYRYAKAISTTSVGPFLDLSFTEAEIQSEIDKAVTKAHSRIGADEVLLLGMIKEFGSTVTGLIYILKKVYKIYKYTKRAQLRRLRKELSFSELQEIYMNARYNLRPLAYDAAGLIRVFQSEEKPARQTFRASSSLSKETFANSTYVPVNISNLTLSGNISRKTYLDMKVRAGVLTQAQPATRAQLLGLDSIVETAWDILQFSFIIDWFVNVGETISAWTPNLGFKTLASWVTVDTLLTQNTTISPLEITEKTVNGQRLRNPVLEQSIGSATRILHTFERRINPTLPIIPSLNVELDPLKILDLAIITKKIFNLKNFRGLRV